MEAIISKMVKDFEDGRLSRRDLVKSLALAAVFAPAASASASASISSRETAAAETGFKTLSLDHISYQVADYRKTRDFYAGLMGMKVQADNGTSQAVLEFGESLLIARNPRQGKGEGKVDHISYKIADWDTDTVKAELERRGLTPRLDKGGDTPNYVSFHVADPDGFDLQISGIAKPGDSEYEKPAE